MNAAHRSTRDLHLRPEPKPAANQTLDGCPKPLDSLPAANGVPKHYAYQALGNQPPPRRNAGH